MLLHTLKLTNFRNLAGEFQFSDSINLVVGKNGAGKTNLLESINFLSWGKSFRTNHEVFSICDDLSETEHFVFARLAGYFSDKWNSQNVREILLEPVVYGTKRACRKTLKVDGNRTFLSKFVGNFYTIVFSPNTIDLVAATPSVRRRDLDQILSVLSDDYRTCIFEYKKVIRNRNKILEKFTYKQDYRTELPFWNEKLIDLGAKVIFQRIRLLEKINLELSTLCKEFRSLGKDSLVLRYISKFTKPDEDCSLEEIREVLSAKIARNIRKEIAAGRSLYGPHREDFDFLLDDRNLRELGSRGQQRLAAFLYKITHRGILAKENGSFPMLLLDDLFSELDKKVQNDLYDFLQGLKGQIILTATSKNGLLKHFSKPLRVIVL